MKTIKKSDVIHLPTIFRDKYYTKYYPKYVLSYFGEYWVHGDNGQWIISSEDGKNMRFASDDDEAYVRPVLQTKPGILDDVKQNDYVQFNGSLFFKIDDNKILFAESGSSMLSSPLAKKVKKENITDVLLNWMHTLTNESKYELYNPETGEIWENDEIQILLEIAYDMLESGESSKLRLKNNKTNKEKIFTLNDLEAL